MCESVCAFAASVEVKADQRELGSATCVEPMPTCIILVHQSFCQLRDNYSYEPE